MRGGTGAIEAGLNVASIIVAWIQALFGLFDRKYWELHWSLAFAIILTLLVKSILGTKKAVIYFTAVIVVTIVVELIRILLSLIS